MEHFLWLFSVWHFESCCDAISMVQLIRSTSLLYALWIKTGRLSNHVRRCVDWIAFSVMNFTWSSVLLCLNRSETLSKRLFAWCDFKLLAHKLLEVFNILCMVSNCIKPQIPPLVQVEVTLLGYHFDWPWTPWIVVYSLDNAWIFF